MPVLLRAVAALALVLVGVGTVPAPASAVYCSGSGVHVVVDFGALGGGVRTGCYATTGRAYGDDAVTGAGFSLAWTMDYPDVVCKVSGAPASEPCKSMPPADAYWGLFEAHGSGWTYSQVGIRGVRLNPGDSIALAWQDGGDTDQPDAAPGPPVEPSSSPSPSPTASPTKAPTKSPTKAPTNSPTKPGSPQPAPAPAAAPVPESPSDSPTVPTEEAPPVSATPGEADKDTPAESPSEAPLAVESPSDSAPSAQVERAPASAAREPEDRLPAAVTWGVFGLLGAALATSAVLARRRRAG